MAQQQQQYQQPAQPIYQSGGQIEKTYQHGATSEWAFGLFDCFSPLPTCCLGYWCPCILFGRTQARMEGEENPDGINMNCGLWYLSSCCCLQSCFQTVQRGNMRKKYNIEGGAAGDFLASFFCGCCTMVQEEKEALIKTTGINPETKQAYQAPAAMTYA